MFSKVDAPPLDYGTGSMFDLIATRYDLINRALALGMDLNWRRTMVRKIGESIAASENNQPKILDLATGTADVALLLAQEIPSATIVGVDPSHNMLEVGRQKVKQQKLDAVIDLQLSDSRNLGEIDSSSFDAATMAFGIRNVPERDMALCEIHRVLRPSSRFCILEFSEPDASFGILGAVARFFIRHVVPVVGGLLSGAPREYLHLQNSIKEFPSPQEFGALMQRLDCGSTEGYFELEELIQMNFGSVQLYVTKAMNRRKETAEESLTAIS